MDSWSKNLELLIKSRTPLIWIKTKEEERLQNILRNSCEKLKVKRNQTVTFNNKGISKINKKDTYDNSIKSNLNLNITFI